MHTITTDFKRYFVPCSTENMINMNHAFFKDFKNYLHTWNTPLIHVPLLLLLLVSWCPLLMKAWWWFTELIDSPVYRAMVKTLARHNVSIIRFKKWRKERDWDGTGLQFYWAIQPHLKNCINCTPRGIIFIVWQYMNYTRGINLQEYKVSTFYNNNGLEEFKLYPCWN